MKVTITGPVTHLCPYVEEVDHGTVTITYDLADGVEPLELHGLRHLLESFRNRKVTHEALTQEVAESYTGVHVTTQWITAGLAVECEAWSTSQASADPA